MCAVDRQRAAAGAGDPLRSQLEDYKKTLLERLRNESLLPVPILLYWAVNDPQAPALKNGVALYDILTLKHPNVRMILVNKAGLFDFREYPDEFNQNIINFIEYEDKKATDRQRQKPTKTFSVAQA
jgi:pimeloyl-ACP methyl ester carboxylesterase